MFKQRGQCFVLDAVLLKAVKCFFGVVYCGAVSTLCSFKNLLVFDR